MNLCVNNRGPLLFVEVFAAGLLVFLSASSQSVAAEEKRSNPVERPQGAKPFKVRVDLVSVTAAVTDKKQNPIHDLTKEDFQILEDGLEQPITLFKIEVPPGVAVALPNTPSTESPTRSVTPAARKIILFLDDYHLRIDSLGRLKRVGENFIRNSLFPTDLVALITASGKFSTEFTKYREYVISSLNNISPLSELRNSIRDCPPLSDYQAYRINRNDTPGPANDALTAAITDTIRCANLDGLPGAEQMATDMAVTAAREKVATIEYDSRSTLLALHALTRRLKSIEGPKILILFSDGFLSGDLYFDIQKAVDNSIRANTVIHTINATGLEATPPGGDAGSPQGVTIEASAAKIRLEGEARLAKEDPLNALAADTGGSFFRNNNDLFGQIQKALARTQLTYVLGYYSTNTRQDGRYRKIVVKVKRPDVEVVARKGYYAPKGDEVFEAQKNEDIREALANAEDFKEISVSLTYNITQTDTARSAVAIQTRVDVRRIPFQKKENRNRNIFSIVTVVYDSNNRFVEGLEKRIDFNLTEPSYRNVLTEGLRSQSTFRLVPGNYKVRTVVREAGEMKVGSATQLVDIAN